MVTFYEVDGFDEFVKFIGCLETKGEPIFVYFAGSDGPDGKSWCPDCAAGTITTAKICRETTPTVCNISEKPPHYLRVLKDAKFQSTVIKVSVGFRSFSAHPIVYAAMETSAPQNAHFLHVRVGDRETQVVAL